MKKALVAIATVALLGTATAAEAHLIAPQRGTVNVVGANVFGVLSVPAAALAFADDDGDALLDRGELDRHEPELRAAIDRGFVITDDGKVATTVRIDLVLSPADDRADGHAAQIVALKHARFDVSPRNLRVKCDLFGRSDAEHAFAITATRHPTTGVETDVATLRPGATEHALFALAPADDGHRAPRGFWSVSALFAAALTCSWARRSKKPTAES